MSVSDTLCRDQRLPARLPAWLNANRQIHLHRRLVKDVGFTGPGRLPSATTPLPPRFLSRDPLARGLLPRGFRGAASRLLQSNAIREHDLEPTEPQRARRLGDTFPCGTAPAEGPRIRGPGTRLSPDWAPPLRSAETGHGRRGDPDSRRLGHLLSQIRELHAGEACTPARPSGRACYEPAGAPGAHPLARLPPEARTSLLSRSPPPDFLLAQVAWP
jgi:hypothetical protein